MSSSQCPDLRFDGHLGIVTLRRPAQANRLELQDLRALEGHVERLAASPEVRVVLLQSEGSHFCSGFQIDAVPGVDAPALFERLCDAWEGLPQVSIAALQGGVWGGATDLALACDFRLGTSRCVMAIPAARLGLHYHLNGMRRLMSRLGPGMAKRLLLAGERVEAQAMLEARFLDELYADEDSLRCGAIAWATHIASLAPLAVAGMKQTLNELAGDSLDLVRVRSAQSLCQQSEDLQEGVRAWRARRAPKFRGH